MSNDFGKAQEMVVASMEYVKVLGFRLRRTEAQRDDWKQVAQSHADEMIKLRQCVDALKAERDAERMVHDEYKERNRELFNRNQRLTAELAVIKDERDALRSTTIDTAARRLLDAFGSLANEPRNGATDDEYRDRIVRKIHSIKMERDALRAEIDNLTTPCDPPGSTHAEPDLTQLHAKGKEAWSDVPNATQWVEDMRGNTEASHDTPAGKEAAEAVVRDSQMTDTHDCGPNCPHCSW